MLQLITITYAKVTLACEANGATTSAPSTAATDVKGGTNKALERGAHGNA